MPPESHVITVRPEQPQDEQFLFELYASTRQEELDAWGWPPEIRSTFLSMQFKASQGYHQAFPDAEFQVVMLDGANAGRLVIHRTREELRLVDIALLPRYRNAGIGAALLQRIFGEAAATKKPLRLHVLKGSRARRFYERLGFVQTGATEIHEELEWHPPAAKAIEPAMPDAVKLPLRFDAVRLQADLAGILAGEFVPHFNTAYYEGDWSAVPLRSIAGRTDQIYPDPTAKTSFADTPLLARCNYVREVLATLHCPLQAVRLLRLKAGSIIKEHRDHELGFEDGEVRLHIPVHTNPGVEFVLNQIRVVMNEGECWYLNVNRPHRVTNRGPTDRVHLVIDCVLNDWLRDLLISAAADKKQFPKLEQSASKIFAMQSATNQELTEKIVAFLRDIGLEIRAGSVETGTVLPGIRVDEGVLVYDPAQLQFPGDLLHEAGHLAVKSPTDRRLAGNNLGPDPAEEMMAIGWSYAAIRHLELPPAVVFHPAGYRGGSQSLLDNFAAGRYLAVPMLQWLGLTHDEKQARETATAPYPKMKTWLRES